MRTYFLIIAFIFFSLCAYTQTKKVNTFAIEVSGIKIGHITATQVLNNRTTQYFIHSEAGIEAIINIRIFYFLTELWLDDKFISSTVESAYNKKNYHSEIRIKNDVLIANCTSDNYSYVGAIQEIFHYSMAQLYFKEPKNQEKVLTENYGKVCEIKEIEPHVYQISINKNTYIFRYKNGELISGKIQNPTKNFSFKRTN
jgi:hypothetical protein